MSRRWFLPIIQIGSQANQAKKSKEKSAVIPPLPRLSRVAGAQQKSRRATAGKEMMMGRLNRGDNAPLGHWPLDRWHRENPPKPMRPFVVQLWYGDMSFYGDGRRNQIWHREIIAESED